MEEPFDTWTSAWDSGTPPGGVELADWQLRRAWKIAEGLAAGNPFYAPRVSLPRGRGPEDFRALPVTTKAEIVADCDLRPPFGTRTVCAPSEIRHIVETSGTSGKGKEVYALDEADEKAIFEAEAVGFWWAGARPGTTALLTLPVGVGAAGLWYYGGLRRIGANAISAGSYTTERKVELIRRYRPEMLIGTPSYIERLASACEDSGLDLGALGVRSLMVAGEAYSLPWAEMIQERWGGATLYEQYGCTERTMGGACPGGVAKDDGFGTLHVPAELAHWEVIDPDTNQPVEDGEYGEMVTTPLHANASPLLRFATRDRVRYIAPGSCPCGRPLAGVTAGGVQRFDDMLKLRGVNVWPATFDQVILAVEGVREYRGLVTRDSHGVERIDVVLECGERDFADRVVRDVTERVRRELGLGIHARIAARGEIDHASGTDFVKVVRWRDKRRETKAGGP